MSDDENRQPPEFIDDESSDSGNDDYSASAIFLAMMRQAAERRQQPAEKAAEAKPAADETTDTPDIPTDDDAAEEVSPDVVAQPVEDAPETEAADIVDDTPPSPPESEPEQAAPPPPDRDKRVVPEASIPAAEAPRRTAEPPRQAAPPAPAAPAEQSEEEIRRARHDAALKEQRIRRVRRRRQQRMRRNVGILGGFFRTVLITLAAAGLASTIFTWFTSPEFFQKEVVTGLQAAQIARNITPTPEPTMQPTPNYLRRIGIVSGHRGPENDPGAVCPDGLTEAEINFNVAQLTVRKLRDQGYSVDLLDEFDARLDNYRVSALVSIHANTCEDFGEYVSGFLVARAASKPAGGLDDLLADCIALHYGTATGLEQRFTLTRDMTDYHSFREIHPLTPAAIIELGFMKDDRKLLTTQQDQLAEAIAAGVRCFLEPDQNPSPSAPEATAEAADV